MSALPKDKRRLRGLVRRAARETLARAAEGFAQDSSDLAISVSVYRSAFEGSGAKVWHDIRASLTEPVRSLWVNELRRLAKRVRRAPR